MTTTIHDPDRWAAHEKERIDRVDKLFPGLFRGTLNREPVEPVLTDEERDRILEGGLC